MKTGDKKYSEKWFELLSEWNRNFPYGHFIARLYTEAALLLKYNGYPDIDGLDECIKKQYDFLWQFCAPNGRSLLIGDAYSLDAHTDIELISVYSPPKPTRQTSFSLCPI